MACQARRSEQIADFAAGHLGGEAVQELLEHLLACEACSEEFDLVAELVELSTADGDAPQLPGQAGSRWRLLSGRLLPLLAAAAVLLLFLTRGPSSELSSLAEFEALPFSAGVLRGGNDDEARRSAMELYRAAEYERAAAALQSLASEDPADALAHFYRGVALLQLERPAQARAPLQAAVDSAEGLLRERALWYLANTELALEEGERARALLERLIALEGEYAFDASAKLEALRALLE